MSQPIIISSTPSDGASPYGQLSSLRVVLHWDMRPDSKAGPDLTNGVFGFGSCSKSATEEPVPDAFEFRSQPSSALSRPTDP